MPNKLAIGELPLAVVKHIGIVVVGQQNADGAIGATERLLNVPSARAGAGGFIEIVGAVEARLNDRIKALHCLVPERNDGISAV